MLFSNLSTKAVYIHCDASFSTFKIMCILICRALFCCDNGMRSRDPFTHITRGYFTGIGQTYCCTSPSERILMNMGEIDQPLAITKYNKPWWRHQMETLSALLGICAGWIHRSPVNSPHKGQWRGALMFSLICAWINSWVNNREAGDLRCYCAHYDVTVMPWNVC